MVLYHDFVMISNSTSLCNITHENIYVYSNHNKYYYIANLINFSLMLCLLCWERTVI